MSLVARTADPGLARYCSAYLVSAGLVLLGSYLTLYDDPSRAPDAALRHVFGTHLAYEVGLLLVVFFLYRFRREEEIPTILGGILGVFIFDGLLLQHRYGWDTGTGLEAAIIGCVSGILFLSLTAVAVELPLRSRLVGTGVLAVLFVRFGPGLLIGADSAALMEPRLVGLGWLLGACLVPLMILPSAARARSRLPFATLEWVGVVGALAFATLHFVTAGQSLDLAFRVAYLAPAVMILGPVIERLREGAPAEPGLDRLARLLPWIGLALAATRFPPGLLDAAWAQAWPLTPFYLCLLLLIAIQVARGLRDRDRPRLGGALRLAALACLGGDFPEMLVRARYPSAWQVIAVVLLMGAACLGTRRPLGAIAGLMAPAYVVASFLAMPHEAVQWELFHRKLPPESLGYPWLVAYLVVLGVGLLILERVERWTLRPLPRLGVVSVVAVLPVLVFLGEHRGVVRLAVAVTVLGGMLVVGLLARDRLFRYVAPISVGLGLLGYPLVLQRHGDVATGSLVMQAGVVVLLLAFLDSIAGGRVRELWQDWWDEEIRARRHPVERRVVSS